MSQMIMSIPLLVRAGVLQMRLVSLALYSICTSFLFN